MTRCLKQSTAVTVKLGPFVDETDGKTAETGLTIKKADVRLSKNGGDMAAANADQGASDVGAAHDELGYYDISLSTTDTNTLGALKVMVTESGALPVWADFMVVTANIWDSLFSTDVLDVSVTQIGGAAVSTSTAQLGVNVVQAAGTAWGSGAITAASIAADAIGASELAADAATEIAAAVWATVTKQVDVTKWNGTAVAAAHTAGYPVVTVKDGTGTGEIDTSSGSVSVNVTQIGGSATAATTAGKAFQGIVSGTAVTGTLTTTAFTTDLTEATNDHYNGRTVTFISGVLAGQQATITDYTGATKLLTVTAMTEAPGNGDQFFIA